MPETVFLQPLDGSLLSKRLNNANIPEKDGDMPINPVVILDPLSGKFITTSNPLAQGLYNPTTGLMEAQRTATGGSSAPISAAGNTALWKPATGKKFRILQFAFDLPIGMTTAAALTVTVKDGATTIIGSYVISAAAIAATTLFQSFVITNVGNGYLSTTKNNVLTIHLSTAITAGSISFRVSGCEE